MIWKYLILVLACACACQSSELNRKDRDVSAIIKNYSVKDIKKIMERLEKSKQSRSGHTDKEAAIQPYHKALQKVEAGVDALDEVLDHPTSTPPINETLRHSIALAYTIHYVAYTLATTIDITYEKTYYDFIDEGFKKGLSTPVENVQDIRDVQAQVEEYIQPAVDLIHEMCGKSKDSSAIETCDMLVTFAIQLNPGKYEGPAKVIIDLATVYDDYKDLEADMAAAVLSFTEEAYLIDGKKTLRNLMTKLGHVYQEADVGLY